MFHSKPTAVLLATSVLLLSGCSKRQSDLPPKAPRPVTVMDLMKIVPEDSFTVSGSATSWKTEQMGFEVGGRVQWVLEPGKNIDGRTMDADGTVIQDGTPLAALDPTQYEVAVDSARASLEAAQLDAEIIAQRIRDSIPADIRSAEADLKLARSEYDRVQLLRQSNAASQADFEDAQNRVATEEARLDRLKASKSQAEVELKAAEARVKSAQQALRDAERDLENTVLYASYPGQISEVQVVPGSVVSAGSPVLTLQMINPIKVAIEVSAKQSRDLERRRQLPVSFTLPDGSRTERNAMVYNVDPSADPSTRTFSVSLLIMNEQYRAPLTHLAGGETFARTQDIWPLKLNKIIGAPDNILVVEENSIERDAGGDYVWVATNARFGERLQEVTTVRKHYLTVLDARLPFLGNWVFRPVLFQQNNDNDGEKIDRESLITGKLEYPDDDRANWDGKSVVVDGGAHWVLRPGDLVSASVSDRRREEGYFVPVEAIYQESDRTYVFLVENDRAKRTEVIAELPETLSSGSLIQIRSLAGDEFAPGARMIVKGVHFLMDGEPVKVITSELPEHVSPEQEPVSGKEVSQ
ncbi:Macrolide export protein MacA [Stieleria maiorica]|uniref:Macrolide export protein MacA n=1 Tax=Stieleria maiorica TaxID=2795974 RepID=A0A5B9MMU3_9BACT|nr:HlyD family efflux transporter periplasmic adaptor subunit [Stieleria maiorica]QEG02264.1 Macrolide export protein MacA [Stieleria maiorica]